MSYWWDRLGFWKQGSRRLWVTTVGMTFLVCLQVISLNENSVFRDITYQDEQLAAASSSSSPAITTVSVEDVAGIDGIYYFNSAANPKRRHFMERWLRNLPVTIHRVEPLSTAHADCWTTFCHYRVGLVLSYLHVLRNAYYGGGTVLFLQDDTISISNFAKLQEAIREIPDTWEAIRLDCKVYEEEGSAERHWSPQHCHQSNAVLWRQGAMEKLGRLLPYEFQGNFQIAATMLNYQNFNLDCMLGSQFETYCLNLGLSHSESSIRDEEPANHVVDNAWFLTSWYARRSMQDIHDQLSWTPNPNPNQDLKIDRIYYLNLAKNELRAQSSEYWLQDQGIPFKRVSALVGETNTCVERHNNTNRCKGISGINKSLVNIIDNENTTGITMVMEDDLYPLDPKIDRLIESLKMVPNDWDIIRFDCWGLEHFNFIWVNDFIVNTTHYWKKEECAWGELGCLGKLYGGAYSMVWRGKSIDKLRKIWATQPYDDADGNIAGRNGVISYCVNIGIWDHLYFKDQWSDASKIDN